MGGVGPIPYGEIAAWLADAQIADADERQEYLTLIAALDAEFLDHVNKRSKA